MTIIRLQEEQKDYVYRQAKRWPGDGPENHTISATHDTLVVVNLEGLDEPSEPSEAVWLEDGPRYSQHIVPAVWDEDRWVPDQNLLMFGGNYVDTSDGRFSNHVRFYGAVAVHDLEHWNAHRTEWDEFVGWCDRHGCQPMPATPNTIVEYLDALADAAAKGFGDYLSIKQRLSSISVIHQRRGFMSDDPTQAASVTTTMKRIRRILGGPPPPEDAALGQSVMKKVTP